MFRDCDECPEMVVVPAGSFMMGSPADEEGWREDESPQHRVTIARPFAIGKFEITLGEFAEFALETEHEAIGCEYWTDGHWQPDNLRSWRNPGFPQTVRDPVTCLSNDDAFAYAEWLRVRPETL